MDKSDCFCLGYITKLFGYKGEVNLFLDVDYPEEYRDLESVFVEINKQLVPFFIEKIDIGKKSNARVKFQGVDSEERAQSILRSSLYLPLSLLPELKGNNFYYFEVVGYSVIDEHQGNIGKLSEVLENPGNPLLKIVNDFGKEILIPINDHTITYIDRSSKEIQVKAPEGLIDLYLEEE